MYIKKLTALTLAALLAVSVAGCGSGKDKSWAAKLDDQTISAGIYVMNVIAGLNFASAEVDPTAVADVLTTDIDGKTGSQVVKDYALEETKKQLATHKKFVELGLTLTDDERTQYEDYAKQVYTSQGDLYKANGVSEQSLIDYSRYSYEASKVFQKLYGPGGEKAATPEEIKKQFTDDNYLAHVAVYYKLDMNTGLPLAGDALTKLSADVDAAYKSIQDGTKTIVDVIYELENGQYPREADSFYLFPVEKVDTGMFPPILTAHMAEATAGAVSVIEDEQFKLIVQKVDENTVTDELAASYYENKLPQMKSGEFAADMLALAETAQIELNKSALDYYTGEKVKKETDAYQKAMEAAAGAATPSSLPSDENTPGNLPAPEGSMAAPAPESGSVAPEGSGSSVG